MDRASGAATRSDSRSLDAERPRPVEVFMQIGMLLRGRGHELYVTHCLELLRRWTAQHPGSQPWAWWSLEATEPRRVVEDPDGLAAVSAAGAFEGVWRRQWGVRFHGNVNAGGTARRRVDSDLSAPPGVADADRGGAADPEGLRPSRSGRSGPQPPKRGDLAMRMQAVGYLHQAGRCPICRNTNCAKASCLRAQLAQHAGPVRMSRPVSKPPVSTPARVVTPARATAASRESAARRSRWAETTRAWLGGVIA